MTASGGGAPSLRATREDVLRPASIAACHKQLRPRAGPELTMRRAKSACGASESTALRKVRSAGERGAMKSVERVECADIFVGRLHALEIVAVDQALARLAVAARPRASRRDFLHPRHRNWRRARRTARPDARSRRENHTAMHETVDTAAIEAVDRHPVDVEIALAQHLADARDDSFRASAPPRYRHRPELQVDRARHCPAADASAPIGRNGTAGRTRSAARSGDHPPPSGHRRSGICPRRCAPLNSSPRRSRMVERAPSAAITQAASRR